MVSRKEYSIPRIIMYNNNKKFKYRSFLCVTDKNVCGRFSVRLIIKDCRSIRKMSKKEKKIQSVSKNGIRQYFQQTVEDTINASKNVGIVTLVETQTEPCSNTAAQCSSKGLDTQQDKTVAAPIEPECNQCVILVIKITR